METNRRERRRHLLSERAREATPAIVDEAEFIENKCSPNAKRFSQRVENTNIDIWIDKHYHIRSHLGDEYGKRDGIEPEKVREIVEEAIRHLIVYSGIVKNFTFLNYRHAKGQRALRIVCQKEYGGNKTNVTIEAHLTNLNEIEITIVTAIQKNDYQPSDGQYVIELLGGGNSTLLHFARNKLNEICDL